MLPSLDTMVTSLISNTPESISDVSCMDFLCNVPVDVSGSEATTML